MIHFLKKLKRVILDCLYKIVYFINNNKKLKNYILFESNPDLTDSPKVVFDKMIEKGINNKYVLIWFVRNQNMYNNYSIKNVKFVQRDKTIKNRIIALYYNFVSKYIIDSNICIKKLNKRQVRIHVSHGIPMKEVRSYFESIGEVNYITVQSKYFVKLASDLYKVPESKIAITGLPRNDCFFKKDIKISEKITKLFGNNKIIIWLPTYRNHKNKKRDKEYNIIEDFKYGVPILDKEDEIINLNNFLKQNELNLLIKLHPAENTNNLEKLKLSNISIINDDMLIKEGLPLYQLLSYSISLITDYSSVYYDYCLTNNPIGLCISDLDEYTKHIKLVFDDYKKEIKGRYIYNYDDLIGFIDELSSQNKEEKMLETKKKYNDYYDGKSSERVIDLLGIED